MGSDDHLGVLLEPSLDDAVFRAMSDVQRRFALYFLLDRRSASIAELADVVTGWTTATDRGMATRADRERVLLSLRHRHLPTLEQAGLVSVDHASETVSFATEEAPVHSLIRWAYAREGLQA